MKCDKCKYKNPDDQTYCINCGAKLPEEKFIPPKVNVVVEYADTPKPKRKENDYYETSYKGPENKKFKPKTGKKLWLCVLLSILVVGLGQIYLKRYK